MDIDPHRIDVSDRLPSALSPSRIDEYVRCPRLFFYKSILKIRTPGTIHTLKGNLAHVCFERIFDLPREQRVPQAALAYVEPALNVTLEPFAKREDVTDQVEVALRDVDDLWADTSLPSRRRERFEADSVDAAAVVAEHGRTQILAEVSDAVANWFTMENPQAFDPAGREVYVRAEVAGVSLHGFIDRFDKIDDGAGGTAWVVSDYKSGKVPSDRWLSDKFTQLQVYALLLRQIHGVTPRLLRLVYVKGDGRQGIKKMPVDDVMLDRVAARLRAVSDSIRDAAKSNDFPPKVHKLCSWCDFQAVCPAFNPAAEGTLTEERELYGETV